LNRDDISQRAREQVATVLGVLVEDISESTDLGADFQVDSLELMEIGARLETAFGIRLAVDDLVGLTDVGDAIDMLVDRLGQPA